MTTDYRHDPVAFIDANILRNEKGQPWTLSRHQRRVLAAGFQWDALGRLTIRTFVWSEMKKSGKTFLAACLAVWWAFVTPHTEIIIAANDLEQSVSRVFATITKILEANPTLGHSSVIRAAVITLTNGTTITAISSDYKGAAGSRHSLAVFDELWGYSLEAAQRLFEELTPPPTEANAWTLIVTYAGWTGESALLERLYKQGLAGERIDNELELFRAAELFVFWSHTPRQPWQDARYYAEQRRSLRPTTFARLHENQWVAAESAFLTAELLDACIEPTHRPCLPDQSLEILIGVDAGIKNDTAAVVALTRQEHRYVLVGHRIWHPSAASPLDLEATIEAYILELARDFTLRHGKADPFQLHRSLTTLRTAGVPIHEFPQTQGNTIRMGQVLFDTIKGRNLVLYPDPELRQHLLNCVALDTPRGFRLAKEKASKKIDVAVALAMALCAALDAPELPPLWFRSGGVTIGEPGLLARAQSAVTETVSSLSETASSVLKTVANAVTGAAKQVAVRTHVLTDDTPDGQTFMGIPTHRRLSPEEISTLPRGSRSVQEQLRLDAWEGEQTRRRMPSALEIHIKRHGIFWPADGRIYEVDPSVDPVIARITQKYQQWK
jgi:phage terminase large subunit-like protein